MHIIRTLTVASAVVGLLGFSLATPAAAQTPTPTATATAAALAPCPAGATLAISAPTTAAPTTVEVTTNPALNIKAAAVGDPTSLHLHYFIDTPATAAGTVVPAGDPKIIHSGALVQDLGALAPGSHTVTVVLGQLTHVACDTRASVTFTTAAAAAQATTVAPKTGNAGMLAGSQSTAAALLVVATVLVVLGGRALATRRP